MQEPKEKLQTQEVKEIDQTSNDLSQHVTSLQKENEELEISLPMKNTNLEEGVSLLSVVKSLRHIKLQHEEEIKNLNKEKEEFNIYRTRICQDLEKLQKEKENIILIFKEVIKIVGIKTDEFDECEGIIFAEKCLDQLKKEMD